MTETFEEFFIRVAIRADETPNPHPLFSLPGEFLSTSHLKQLLSAYSEHPARHQCCDNTEAENPSSPPGQLVSPRVDVVAT
jgi:hypothetical protein